MDRKHFRRGSHRVCDPAETLVRVVPLAPVFGVVRIADLTGLDLVGMPFVAVAVRPASRGLCVPMGKGVTEEAARASALMEAIEQAAAEADPSQQSILSATQEEAAVLLGRTLHLDALPRVQGRPSPSDERILWRWGVDVATGRPALVPEDLVHLDLRNARLARGNGFVVSSNGLACGNTLTEATVHAIAELIERDALALLRARSRFGVPPADRRIDLDSVDDPDAVHLIEASRRAGLECTLWDATSDVGVAAVLCRLVETDRVTHPLCSSVEGAGAHPARSVAVVRALSEAMQTRITMISGARDDLARWYYGYDEDPVGGEGGDPPPVSYGDLPDLATETLEGDLALLVDRLATAGMSEIWRVDLTPLDLAGRAAVVRCVVPGLEPMVEAHGRVPGARALSIETA